MRAAGFEDIKIKRVSFSYTLRSVDELWNLALESFVRVSTIIRAQTADTLVLDLHAVPYIDSAGLGAIVNAHVSAQKRGGKVLLIGVNDRVRSLLDLTKVTSVLNITD